jgi:hypothetical protein
VKHMSTPATAPSTLLPNIALVLYCLARANSCEQKANINTCPAAHWDPLQADHMHVVVSTVPHRRKWPTLATIMHAPLLSESDLIHAVCLQLCVVHQP